MFIKVELNIEIDNDKYQHVKPIEIRKIIKETANSGHVIDYIKDNAHIELEELEVERWKNK